nr:MAG TPA: hypothetical protein [Caudoviricetes sp.]
MGEKKYTLKELSELYYQGFFRNTRVGQDIEDKLAAYNIKVLMDYENELSNTLEEILEEENISDTSEYYRKLIDDKRLTRVNTAIFNFIAYLKTHHPDMMAPIGRPNKDKENYLDLASLRLQFKATRDLFSKLYDLYQTFYTRNRYPYINQRLFLEKLSGFPYYFKKDEDKQLLSKNVK